MEKPEKATEEIKKQELIETQPEPVKAEEKTDGEAQILSEREQNRLNIENIVIGETTPLPPETKEVKEEVKVPETTEEKEPEISDEERLQAKIKKRIGKEVAKRKTLEEELAETRAEIERLKSAKPEVKKEESREPTQSEIATALKKAREEGDTEFEVQILDYIAERKAKKERLEAEQQFINRESQVTERQRKWSEIVNDYTVVDENGIEIKDDPLNLNNMNSQLYKTANALYLDRELKKERYSSGSEMENLRRAVSDAYVELTRMGVSKKEKTVVNISAKERQKNSLVEPRASKEESSEINREPRSKSNEENVQDEILNRMKYKRERSTALI